MNDVFFYANIRTYDLTLGITRKVYQEILAFKRLGYSVTFSGYTNNGVAIFDTNFNVIKERPFYIKNPKIQHIIRRWKLINLCIDYIKEKKEKYAFSYVRYHFFDKAFIRLLKILKSYSFEVIMEAHSTPKFPKKISIMNIVGILDKIYGKLAHYYLDLVASMSGEDNMWGVKTIQIENAIDIDLIKPHEYKGEEGDINFISVAYERDVHGYDRLIRGIYEYKKKGGNRKIYFRMVGSILKSSQNLIKQYGLQDICLIYGPLYGEKLEEVYDLSNIAVGCLANHRIGSYYGSALKTKEYIAKGIPFIYGWNEAVLEGFEYGLKIDLREEPVDIEKVIAFYDAIDKDELVNRIRGKLGVKDTWDYQMKIVVDSFLDHLE